MNVDIKGSTVSGLSAGGYMSVQMHVAYSDVVWGAAVFAGGPYHCAQASMDIGTSTCMIGLPRPNPTVYVANTNDFFRRNLIANPANMRTHQVYLFSGTLDILVRPPVMDALAAYYRNFLPNSSIEYMNTLKAAHTQPTDDPNVKLSCTLMLPPFISNCNYDGAGHAFKKLYGQMQPRNNGTLAGALVKFDQSEFLPNPRNKSMDTSGFVFIPKQCAAGQRCKLHVSFHGCTQDAATLGDTYSKLAGYNKWADTNNIVVLYPQVRGSNGCFDWYGYNSKTNYDVREGAQMKAVFAMMQRIGSGLKPE